MNPYTEFSFDMPFFDLVDDSGRSLQLEKLMPLLNIYFDAAALYDRYLSYGVGADQAGKGDVFVFFHKTNPDRFIVIDMFCDFTDQYNMVKLGVRCEAEEEDVIRTVLQEIHSGAEVASEFQESYDGLLQLEIHPKNFPQEIRYGDHTYIKDIHYFT